MCEIEWINEASKSLGYCTQLLQQIKHLKENLEKLEEEATRLKTLVKKTGGAAWLQHSPLNWKIC